MQRKTGISHNKNVLIFQVSQKQEGTSRVLSISQEKFCAEGPIKGNTFVLFKIISRFGNWNNSASNFPFQVVFSRLCYGRWVSIMDGTR